MGHPSIPPGSPVAAASGAGLRSRRDPGAGPPLARLGLVLTLAAGLLPARAELPPWVYGERQRAAPLVLGLRIETVQQRGDALEYRGRITSLRRQPQPPLLRQGQAIRLLAPLPPQQAPGLAGPSPVPRLQRGQQVTAWLEPIEGRPGWFAPAAGGRSFGPSLEEMRSGGP